MNKEQYAKKRQALMTDAETLIHDGKTTEAKAKMEEVKKLDNQWDEVKREHANLEALKDKTKLVNLADQGEQPKGEHPVAQVKSVKPRDEAGLYKTAFYKKLTGRALNADEQNIFRTKNQLRNEFTHTTENTGILIPETVAAGIWKRAEELYPLYADSRKYAVSGNFTIKRHAGIRTGDANWYEEATPVEDEENAFDEFTLSGRELAKSVTVSWKLKSMAIDAFLPFLQNELGERIGVALGNAAAHGAGPTATAPEPFGVETAIFAQAQAPQLINYKADGTAAEKLSYTKLTQAMAKVHSSYLAGSSIYANNTTIWNQLANLLDGQGRPLFIPDVTSGGVGHILGLTVKADAGVSAGNILFGNASAGLVFNTNEPLRIVSEDHAKQRETDYVAYTVTDGGVFDEQAFALISETVPPAAEG